MNNFMLVDLKENAILFLNKVNIDFEINEKFTSSISCIDKKDLIEELEKIIQELKETN